MRPLRDHGPVFLLLLLLAYAAFGRIASVPLWNGTDARILCDAHELSAAPREMFRHIGFYFSQPLLQLVFLAEYKAFGLTPAGYIVVNLFIHAVNSFVVYMLVNMLFPRRHLGVLAAVLFAFGVGSYGRVFTSIHQLEDLLLANLQLLVLYVFIRNDFRHGGRVFSFYFGLGLGLFLLSGLTKATSFSLVGALVAYKAFFHGFRRRRILSADILIFLAVAALFYWAQARWGYQERTVFGGGETGHHFTITSFKNIFRYLNLMFFPMQQSPLLEEAPAWVVWVYEARRVIRTLLALAIVSYSFFGFVFGSRAIRFFIAWTYITLLPFTGQPDSGGWLNLSHLYLTSVGFCVVLAAGTVGTSSLLVARPRRRWVPFVAPLIFVLISLGLTDRLIDRDRRIAATPEAVRMRLETAETCGR